MTIAAGTITRLKQAVGAKGFTEDTNQIAPHLVEWRSKYQGRTPLMLRPQTTEEVSKLLAICNETRTPIVPQGGNTGLVGGQIPFNGEVLLSLSRMNRIRDVDTSNASLIAEAGAILDKVHHAALDAGMFFPLSLSSEGSCTIGGNLSTNAGGVNVLRYGSARELVLGLEVVLADGRVLDLLRTLRKDNTGYDLKQIFLGAEGTLGVITAAALKLFPAPVSYETAFISVPNPAAAVAMLDILKQATGGLVSAFELIPRIGIEFVVAHIPGTTDPLKSPSPWYVLTEAPNAGDISLRDAFEKGIAEAIENGLATDAALATSDAQRNVLWKIRDGLSEAQKPEGASIKHDVSVPIRKVSEFLSRGTAMVSKMIPGVRPVSFGHLGDGNIHFNFSVPKGGDNDAFLAQWSDVARAVHDLVNELGGSVSAEHGVGVMKREDIIRYKSATEIDTMRLLKLSFDPNNILNPGKVV